MLKRTCVPHMTEPLRAAELHSPPTAQLQARLDMLQRLANRQKREARYEKRRLANARMSGRGMRECRRRCPEWWSL